MGGDDSPNKVIKGISIHSENTHNVNYKIFGNENLINPLINKYKIPKEKALSVLEIYRNETIIASDQILVCEKKVLSKPRSLEEATKKLLFLRNKAHELYSSIYVIHKGKFYFQQVKDASLFFANISQNDIELYVKNNKKTVLTTVGSYKIEENSKYKFLRIIEGDRETILGFPIEDLIKKIKNEK